MTISFDEFREAHSNYSDVPAQKEETWKGVISMLDEEGWTPFEYLDFVFREYRAAMVPSILTSAKTVKEYRIRRKQRVENNTIRTGLALDQVKCRLDNGYTLPDILQDKELTGMSTLMYLVSLTGRIEPSSELRDASVYELRTMPELVDIYAGRFNRRLLPWF